MYYMDGCMDTASEVQAVKPKTTELNMLRQDQISLEFFGLSCCSRKDYWDESGNRVIWNSKAIRATASVLHHAVAAPSVPLRYPACVCVCILPEKLRCAHHKFMHAPTRS